VDVTVINAVDRQRYEAHIGDDLAGIAEYHADNGLVTFTHTEVMDGFEGRGVASSLLRGALDDVRRQQRSVRAECEFAAGFIERHTAEDGDLLAPAHDGSGD
jgi:uncharacterized protein